ncbi:MAG: nucleoside monophosphate kinase [Candidatus Gracilibacteria bacterium]
MDLVLFGIQGSGKGTLGKVLAEKYNLQIFETGSALRKLSQETTPLAQKVKSIIEAGHLVPTEVVMEIIEDFMNHLQPGSNVLFDGIPRKMDQAEAFDQLMQKHNRNFLGLLIDVSEEVAIKRLSTRRLCKNCKTVFPATYTQNTCEKCGGELITRTDDNPESIKIRLKAYFEETMPVIENYKKGSKMISIDGTENIEKVQILAFEALQGKFN